MRERLSLERGVKVWSTFSFAATELSYAGMCTLKVKGARKALFAILQHIMHNELIFYLKNPQTSNSMTSS